MSLFSFFKRKPVQIVEQITIQQPPKREATKMNFTTREEYFEYRTDWKKRYFETISKIRQSALTLKSAERDLSKFGIGFWDGYKNQDYKAAYNAQEKARSEHRSLKRHATELLNERMDSKILAGQQRELRLKKIA